MRLFWHLVKFLEERNFSLSQNSSLAYEGQAVRLKPQQNALTGFEI